MKYLRDLKILRIVFAKRVEIFVHANDALPEEALQDIGEVRGINILWLNTQRIDEFGVGLVHGH